MECEASLRDYRLSDYPLGLFPEEHIVVSLTHLRVLLEHPLGEAIREYQRARIKKLAQQNRVY